MCTLSSVLIFINLVIYSFWFNFLSVFPAPLSTYECSKNVSTLLIASFLFIFSSLYVYLIFLASTQSSRIITFGSSDFHYLFFKTSLKKKK